MPSHAFGMHIDFEPSIIDSAKSPNAQAIPIAPQKAKPRNYHSVPLAPSDIELDSLQWGDRFNGPTSTPASGIQTPRVNDLEMSRPPSPRDGRMEVEAIQSFWYPRMNRYRMVAVCAANFCSGISDSAPGALIPYIEK